MGEQRKSFRLNQDEYYRIRSWVEMNRDNFEWMKGHSQEQVSQEVKSILGIDLNVNVLRTVFKQAGLKLSDYCRIGGYNFGVQQKMQDNRLDELEARCTKLETEVEELMRICTQPVRSIK